MHVALQKCTPPSPPAIIGSCKWPCCQCCAVGAQEPIMVPCMQLCPLAKTLTTATPRARSAASVQIQYLCGRGGAHSGHCSSPTNDHTFSPLAQLAYCRCPYRKPRDPGPILAQGHFPIFLHLLSSDHLLLYHCSDTIYVKDANVY